MSKALVVSSDAIRKVILHGDLSGLTPDQKDNYYMTVCEAMGLNHLTKPFEFIKFQGKEIMYANKGCAEQLRMIHKIGLKVVSKEKIEDVYVVTTEAVDREGRTDSATGAVSVTGLKGDALANAFMKAETKSKRRVTLSICGLNMLDETEVETMVPDLKKAAVIEQGKFESSPREKKIKDLMVKLRKIMISEKMVVEMLGVEHVFDLTDVMIERLNDIGAAIVSGKARIEEYWIPESPDKEVTIEAIVTRENKDLAKNAGFKWNPDLKKWLKTTAQKNMDPNWAFEIRAVE